MIAPRLLLAAIALTGLVRADNPDLAFTAFRTADPNNLGNGQVMQARGGLIPFERGLTSQALYIIDAPVETVRQKLVSWNPAAHSELKVWLHEHLSAKPTAAEFAHGLQNVPDNSSIKNLIEATAKLSPSDPTLQCDKSEAQLIAGAGSDARGKFINGWSQVLAGRAARFLGGNFVGDHYDTSDGQLSPMSEIISLLRSDAYVYRRFHNLLADTPVYKSNRAVPATTYCDCFDIEGSASLGTGAVYQTAATPGNPVLSADIEYFVNSGIYVSVELEQLSPITINGRNETLVWRNDLVSTWNVAYLHGTERLASGMLMLQDVKQAVDAFRSEFK